jgi:uncharacterized glyoxalase superfamily protein PhnB
VLSGFDGADGADQGVWIFIWVDDVNGVHKHCLEQGLQITLPPTDERWSVRELQVCHPDGHVFRIGQQLEVE